MKRPTRCANCGAWIIRAFASQTVCCVDWQGPRWADDRRACEEYKIYKEWAKRVMEKKS